LDSDRAALRSARLAADPAAALREAIAAWSEGQRDEEGLEDLINLICRAVIDARRSGDAGRCEEVAAALEPLHKVPALPIAGSRDFPHVLQLWLRDDPSTEEEQARLRAMLTTHRTQKSTETRCWRSQDGVPDRGRPRPPRRPRGLLWATGAGKDAGG